MKRRIFISMCILAAVTVALSSLLTFVVMHHRIYNLEKEDVKEAALYIASGLSMVEDPYSYLQNISVGSNRITLVAEDGSVLYDSVEKAENMDNHLDRPEISAAMKNGFGESVRLSATLHKQTFYYAVLLNNGMVVRVASTVDSVFRIIAGFIPYAILIIIITFILALLVAGRETAKIIQPINKLDLHNPESNEIYDELSPLLSRIAEQNTQIENQMRQLREKQEEFTAISQNMREGLIVLNEKAEILSINNSTLHIFGAQGQNYLNKNILVLSRDLALSTAVKSALEGKPSVETLTIGNHQYQLIANTVWVDGHIKGAVALILDVTERYAAEQMRREFTANVSHELKTPLTSISGYAEIIKNGLVKTEDIPLFAQRIHTEASHLIDLIEDIMRLSCLDENNVDMSREPVDLMEVSKDVCQRLESLAKDKNVTVSVSGENAIVLGSRQILEQMIYNLCDNAIKYNRNNGSVNVIISRLENGVELTVSDTGIGIPKEHQNRIFERFYRVDKSHSSKIRGTGLGLSIVKHGAIYHDAKIQLESEAGKGTTIRLVFPLPPINVQ